MLRENAAWEFQGQDVPEPAAEPKLKAILALLHFCYWCGAQLSNSNYRNSVSDRACSIDASQYSFGIWPE